MAKQKARRRSSAKRERDPLEGWRRPPLVAYRERWRTAPLFAYLRQLQARYRRADLPFPTTPEERADEARQRIFNAHHIFALLVGWAGPWFDPAGPKIPIDRETEPETEPELWRLSLPFIRNQLQQVRARAKPMHAARVRAARVRAGRRNRQIGKAKSDVKAIADFQEESRQKILKLLDAGKASLPTVSSRLPRIGITKNAAGRESTQAYWTPIASQLVRYLKRSCTGASEEKCFEITAQILHLASGGAFPTGARGTAAVKQRYYRSL